MSLGGYFASPWPAEDGGPQRLQTPSSEWAGVDGLRMQPHERLACVTRTTCMSTMTVLGARGDVFLLHHSAIRSNVGLPTTACVERIDPLTLRPLARSPRLAGGPMWPGGVAVLRSGALLVVYGRYMHRLNRDCEVLGKMQLPMSQPYNSFVVLDNGLVVTKNLSDQVAARLTVVHPESMERACADIDCPEPSIARLSAVGNTVYVVGVRNIVRYHWSDASLSLERDRSWCYDYIGNTAQSYGWDVVLDGQHAWFMDNGKHRYRISMLGAGVSPSPNRLIRVALEDAHDHQVWDVCGIPGGSITNPPLVDVQRRIVVGYDSANRFLQAWRFDDVHRRLEPLWHKAHFGCASHMILYPSSGELFVNDYRRRGEDIVLLQIETGQELGRVRSGGLMQGVVFPSVGWNRDIYWSSMGKLARVFVQG